MDQHHTHAHHHGSEQTSGQVFVCPMHPDIIRNQPGQCPKCGMDLVPLERSKTASAAAHDHSNHTYDKHRGHHTQDFLKRFWICTALTIPLLLLSHMIQQWFGFHVAFPGSQYVVLLLSTFIYAYGGWPFITGMIGEIKGNAIGMMTLVAIAITVAFCYSVAVVFGLPGMDFFWELATLIDIMLLGHWLEMRSQMAASRALESLIALLPATVHVERDGQVIDIPLRELQHNEIALIKPGEKFPADGVVIHGTTEANESMLTGESMPVKKNLSDKVIGGSINGAGAVKIKIVATGQDSYLQKVISLVTSAQASKSNTQNLADRVAKWLTIVSISVGVITLLIWLLSGEPFAFALERMVTVMVTACPHALGVAIPLVVAVSTTISAVHGLLIRNRTAFELSRKIDTIIFDKTGTLTEGSHSVQRIVSLDSSMSPAEILGYASAVQQSSEHHIAHGIINEAKKQQVIIGTADQFQSIPGQGVRGMVDGKSVVVAGPNYLSAQHIPSPALPADVDQATETVTYVLVEGKVVGFITMSDAIRNGSAEAIRQLQALHIACYLLTGDNEHVAKRVSGELGMNGYFANVLPHEKLEKISAFQRDQKIVAMVGDGVNDAPALAQADVGIAIGSGTDVAAETADIILVNSDPADVVQLIRFAKATFAKMTENLWWAVGYNVIAIPLAAGILYPAFVLTPMMGAILMSLSTIIVAVNARRLRFA